MLEIPLGKKIKYKDSYDRSILFPIKRSLNRNKRTSKLNPLFYGYDLWNCYEISWLNHKGKPEVRIIHFIVPADSEYLIESKSIKLYFNSFNNTKFINEEEIFNIIKNDLSNLTGSVVEVLVNKLDHYHRKPLKLFDGVLLDDIDTEILDYYTSSALLQTESYPAVHVKESVYSNLFKSNCLVTGQPDWASVQIKYIGQKINHPSLLKYLISYRNHNAFHEDCVEQIYIDILEKCKPKELSVYAKYTRRGGIDICPFRTNLDLKNVKVINNRDVRQ